MVRLLDWNVFSQTCTLVNVRTGAKVKLSPRAMDVLNYLIKAQAQVVSSAELLDNFWSSSVNSDHAVHNTIAELRATLGDDAGNPSYIKTYPKRGYSLIAVPEKADVPASTGQASARRESFLAKVFNWKISFLAIAALVIAVFVSLALMNRFPDTESKVILVRPLENINVDVNNQFWSDQLPASLVTHLSKLPDTIIISGFGDYAVDQYRQANFNDDIDYVLGGNVQQAGNDLRLQINLIDMRHNAIVFSEQFDISTARVFQVHDDVGTSVVNALSIYLDDTQKQEMQNWGTSNPLAYSHFLEAGYYRANSNHDDLELAIEHYSSAINEDPAFINAYIGLVRTASGLGTYSHNERNLELITLVNNAIQMVYRLDPRHESVTELQNHLLRLEADSRPLIEESLRELILSGKKSEFVYSRYATLLAEARMYDEASQFLSSAGDERPYTIPLRATWLYQTYFDTPENLIQTQKKILLERPDHIGILSALIRGLAFTGDRAQATHYFQRQMEIDKEGPYTMLSHAIISGLWGSSTEAGDQFEQDNLYNPNYNLSHGVKSFITGEIESGIAFWRSLSLPDIRRLSIMAHKVEMYFPDHVLLNPSYQALLEELGIGISWQRHLMESIQSMSSVTGINLSAMSREAYDANKFLAENNLWDHSHISYPNRGEGLSTVFPVDSNPSEPSAREAPIPHEHPMRKISLSQSSEPG